MRKSNTNGNNTTSKIINPMIKIIDNTDPLKGPTVMNCNPSLIHYNIPVHSPDWHDFRTVGIPNVYAGGIGGSEVVRFLKIGKEDYSPVLPAIIEHKVGITKPQQRVTKEMFWGIENEAKILDMWEYYDGTKDGYITNRIINERKREREDFKSYIVNKKFPWLFVSLDSTIKKGYSTLEGELLTENCPLECKTMGMLAYQAMEKEGYNIKLDYIYQGQQQMLVSETDYMEYPILIGGNDMRVEYLRFNQEIGEKILETTYPYWQLILRLREMKEERDAYRAAGKEEQAQHIDHMIQQELPLPGSGDAYDPYYTEKHHPTADEAFIVGKTKHFKMVRERQKWNEVKKYAEEKVSQIDNLFSDTFVKERVNLIEFGTRGKLKFRKYKNNYAPDYKSIKEKADKLAIRQHLNEHLNNL